MADKEIVIDALERVLEMLNGPHEWRQHQWYDALEKLAKSVSSVTRKKAANESKLLRKLADAVCNLGDLLCAYDGLLTMETTPNFIRLIGWARRRYTPVD